MTKPPVPVKPTAPERTDALSERIARMRSALGKPERRVIPVVCSNDGTGFLIIYERTDPRSRFKIAAIEKSAPDVNSGQAVVRPAEPAQVNAEAFGSDDFDNSGYACPCCRNASGRVYHDRCNTSYCGAQRVREQGGEQFTCPTCRETFGLVTATTILGVSAKAAAAAPDQRLLGRVRTLLLPRRGGG